jgi:hypothetical protein
MVMQKRGGMRVVVDKDICKFFLYFLPSIVFKEPGATGIRTIMSTLILMMGKSGLAISRCSVSL